MRRPVPAALLLVGLLALTACSGGSKPAASPPSRSPAPTASATPPTTTAPSTAPAAKTSLSAWKSCTNGFQCATLTVPLDDAKPSLGTVGLKVTRHRATGSNRIGSLLVNPGGPGASAVEFVQNGYTDYPSTIRQHFDIVAFDPRGVGQTSPVRCETTAQLDVFFHLDPTPDTPEEVRAFDDGNREFAKGCQARSARILPYVSTTVVAADMDKVRQAVGDAKLTYLGYSYGTAIGAAYLDAFPTHVRAMVLDGALDPTLTWDQLLSGQSRGFDVALGAFMANCQKITCAFRKAVQGDLLAAFDSLAKGVETTPLPGSGSRVVGPQEFTLGVGLGLYSKSYWPTIAGALADAVHGKGATLLELSDAYLERTDSGYANVTEANNAVNCLDRPWPRTDAPYQALAKEIGKKYPRFGPAIALSGGVCEFWPLAPTGRPHRVVAAASPPIVVIGTTRDPATPYSWAQALASQLAHGVLLTHNGDGHTVYRTSAPGCITSPVDDYLVSLKVPATSTC